MDFYPRPPRGGRRIARIQIDHRAHISIHVLREEDDPTRTATVSRISISIHVLREEDDLSVWPG